MAVTWDSGHKGTLITLSNGSLTAAGGAGQGVVLCTVSLPVGRTYGEFRFDTLEAGNNSPAIGVALVGQNLNSFLGDSTNSIGYYGGPAGGTPFTFFNNGAGSGTGPAVPSAGQIVRFAADTLNSRLYWDTNGANNWNGTGADPVAGTGGITEGVSGTVFFAVYLENSQVTANFGATAFSFPILGGYNALDVPGALPFAQKVM